MGNYAVIYSCPSMHSILFVKMTKTKKVSIGIASAILLSVAWYCVAADYSYCAVSGTYKFEGVGEVSTLVLRKDGSFQQELSRGDKKESGNGTWRRIGEGGIVLSKNFCDIWTTGWIRW